MMIKVIPPGSYDFGEQSIKLIKTASSGLRGNDLSALIKRAGHEFADLVKKMDRNPGEELVHLIALGSTESVGPNRNGDGFKNACCRKYHRTFVKHARFYRSHLNKNPKISYGIVKASMFREPMKRVELVVALNGTKEAADKNGGLVADEEINKLAKGDEIGVSMSCKVAYDVCLAGESLIVTRSGLKPISEIEVGEEVLTHRGRWRTVIEKFKRSYVGTMVSLEAQGIIGQIRATNNHPIMVLRQEPMRTCIGSVNGQKRKHTFRSNGSVCVTCKVEPRLQHEWLESADIRCGDYLTYPVQVPGTTTIPAAVAYLAGIYTGDGSLIWRRRGRRRDGEFALRGISVTIDNDTPEITNKICCEAKAVHNRLQPVYAAGSGRDATQIHIYHKDLAKFVLTHVGEGSATKRLNEAVFSWNREARLLFLAGCLDSDGSVDRNLRYGSGRYISINYELAYTVQKLWWGLGVPAGLHEEHPDSTYNKGPTTVYIVSIPRWGVAMLNGYAVKALDISRPNRVHARAFLRCGYMHFPVQRLVHEYNELDVYNLAVEEDETYVVNGVIVHNCSGCKNKASSRKHYCLGTEEGGICKYGGLKNNIGTVHEDGHHLHADNPHPLFFDISRVFRPADRTAFITGKVASAGITSGAELAEIMGVTAPFDILDEFDYGGDVMGRIKIARELATREQAYTPNSLDRAFSQDSEGGVDGIEDFHHHQHMGVLSALTREKIALSVLDWLRFTTGASGEKCAEAAAEIEPCLPSVFRELLEDTTLTELLQTGTYKSADIASSSISNWAHKQAADHSLDRVHVQKRVWRSAVRQSEFPKTRVKSASAPSEAARQLARQYGVYQIGFLHDLRNTPDFDLSLDLIIRKNRVQ